MLVVLFSQMVSTAREVVGLGLTKILMEVSDLQFVFISVKMKFANPEFRPVTKPALFITAIDGFNAVQLPVLLALNCVIWP